MKAKRLLALFVALLTMMTAFTGCGGSMGTETENNVPPETDPRDNMEEAKDIGVTLSSIFANGMVLQRNKQVPVWGWGGTAGDVITVAVSDENGILATANATVDAKGEFEAVLPAMEGGDGRTLIVANATTGKYKSYAGVGVGEVWYCSGQSNMELKMNQIFDVDEIIAKADNYDVRSFFVNSKASYEPQQDVSGSWKRITSKNASGVSAIGYLTAYQLQEALDVPVAIIECYLGGTSAQAWLSYEKIFSMSRINAYDNEAWIPSETNEYGCEGKTVWEDYDYFWSVGKLYETTADEGTLVNGEHGSNGKAFAPTGLYNGMQAPLSGYAIAGVMWYQGESRNNVLLPDQYNYFMCDLIEQWREDFRDDDLPVMIVQLAPNDFSSERSFFGIREATIDTAKRMTNVGIISTAYEGLLDNKDSAGLFHPGTKVPVGNRMAATILGMVYDVAYYEGTEEYTGPVFERMEISGNKAILYFSHIGDGLKIKDGDTALTGFQISANGKTFVKATATIVGDTVEVYANGIDKPVEVRYCYINCYAVTGAPDTLGGNLENSISQPALPFRATLSNAEIHSVTVVGGKVNVEIWERGHNETAHKVIIKVGNTEKEYASSFETAGNFVITSDIAVASGDTVTVILKSADGLTEIGTKTIAVK